MTKFKHKGTFGDDEGEAMLPRHAHKTKKAGELPELQTNHSRPLTPKRMPEQHTTNLQSI